MEGDVGARELAPVAAVVAAALTEGASSGSVSRLGHRWLLAICTTVVVLSVGVAAGGYLSVRSHRDSQAAMRDEISAVQSAKDCVAATNAPDTTAMAASQQKIIDCAAGDFGVQANLYTGVLVDAYQASNVKVRVSDIRAAPERHNPDGSIDVLVAVRVTVTNSQVQEGQEVGYRLRVRMARQDGRYRIVKLDQVST